MGLKVLMFVMIIFTVAVSIAFLPYNFPVKILICFLASILIGWPVENMIQKGKREHSEDTN
jgi:hypothetical protein